MPQPMTVCYTVIAAPTGEEALRMAEENRDSIRLLVTDILLPGIDGAQLAKALKAIIPALKVIYVSGNPGDSVPRDAILGPESIFLSKPFTRRTLLEKVAVLLPSA
jgi:two-component system cell cycle sensor histidine kinase/response regulator CckA